MREPQFTQAKWGFMYVGEGHMYITFDGKEFPGERDIDDEISSCEFEADARLINAAPKMYTLLRKLAVDGVIDRKEAIAIIRSVDMPNESEDVCDISYAREHDSLWFLKY